MKKFIFLALLASLLSGDTQLSSEEKMHEFYHKILFELENALEYTPEEHQYIKQHQNINVCLRKDMFPYDGYDNNQQIGISADLLQKISQKTHLNFIPIQTKSLQDLEKKIQNNQCKMISIVNRDQTKTDIFLPSVSFYKTYFTVISSIDKPFVTNIQTLKNKTLLINKQQYKEKILKSYPYLHIEVETNIDKMMRQVIHKKVYGAIELNEASDYLIQNYDYGKLKINAFLSKDNSISLSLGINKNEPTLLSIINKTLTSISPEKIEALVDNWHLTRYYDKTNYSFIIISAFIMFIIFMIMAFYQRKLKGFNQRLEEEVLAKTFELRQLNQSLEMAVEQKIEELIKKDKILTIQSKQAVMGEMITMIAHQWRQPLSNITLLISNLQIERLVNKKIDEQKFDDVINKISQSVTYLADTIDDFQTFFQPDRVATKIKPIDFFDKVINLIAPRIKEEKIQLKIHSIYNQEINIYVNELVQVILNILNNAIDALNTIDKKEKNIDIDIQEYGDFLHILITDNGCGIPEDIIKNLFDPYFSTKGKNGTGLGLYMSQMIMQKQFNGDIDVESSLEKGTTFIIKFPKNLD